MIQTILAVVFGLALLAAGGDVLVRGAVSFAQRLRVSPLITGMLIVGAGTSMPEMVASVQAALAGSSAIAWGNIVGSNIANALLILGLAALIAPIRLRGIGKQDAAAGMVAGMVVWALAAAGLASRGVALMLLASLVIYMAWRIKHLPVPPEQVGERKVRLWLALVQLAGGLGALVIGARLLVGGAITLAQLAGVSEAAIGLTVVAVGTSLPELAATIAAALRGRPEMAVGNVVGSNLVNLLLIGGVTMMVSPMKIAPELLPLQFPALFLSALAVFLLCQFAKRLWRIPAALLIAGFGANTLIALSI